MLTPYWNRYTHKQDIIVSARQADDMSAQEKGDGARRLTGGSFYYDPHDHNRIIASEQPLNLPTVEVTDETLLHKVGEHFYLPRLDAYEELAPQASAHAWHMATGAQPPAPEPVAYDGYAAPVQAAVPPPMPEDVYHPQGWTQPLVEPQAVLWHAPVEAAPLGVPPGIAQLHEHNAYLSGQLKASHEAAGESQQQIRDLQDKLSKAPNQAEIDGLLREKRNLDHENRNLHAQVVGLNTRLNRQQQELESLGAENHRLRVQVNGQHTELQMAASQNQRLQAQIAGGPQQLQALLHENHDLKGRLNDQIGYIQRLEALLRETNIPRPVVYVGPGATPPAGATAVPSQRPAPGTQVPRRLYDPKAG